jgi:predicted nucleic acid-binding protein
MNAPRWRICSALALVLVTNNDNEFQRVPGLMLENWV